MPKQILHTSHAPAAIGPYSQAVTAGGAIYVSGQLPIDPATGKFAGEDISSQTKQSIENIRAILVSAGADIDNVVQTTVFLKDMAEFEAMNKVYAEYFTNDCPARAAVQVGCLPMNAHVEIGAVAVL